MCLYKNKTEKMKGPLLVIVGREDNSGFWGEERKVQNYREEMF